MKYAFRFTTHAQRRLRTIDRQQAMRILTALTALGDDPYREDADTKKLTGHDGLFRLRVGSFRIVYEIHDNVLTILVLHVGNRGDVYRSLPKS
ncbi:type II toxin-antitoxin system RelE/ParE family toxin [Streptomyces sp. NPDC059524]|uniref:type II toxin-antitoxin system RelE family toxin n=1 Tax=Streptomyces sp. NPDC059524 TaxID=3346856 RepID=UPI003699DFD1